MIDTMPSLAGKVDMMRYETLIRYGGLCLDADSECIAPLDDFLIDNDSFTCFENEYARPGLLAVGCMASTPDNEFFKLVVSDLLKKKFDFNSEAWETVGNRHLTETYRKHKYDKLKVYPSHYFLPRHYSGQEYSGSDKVYAKQYWGSTGNTSLYKVQTAKRDDANPVVLCVTPTFGRFNLLQEMLWSWTQQTYENKRLLIVNDQPNLIITCKVPGVTVENYQTRFKALGAKRNHIRTRIPHDVTYVVTMDDDDLFLPNYIKGLVEALQKNPSMNRSRSELTYVTIDNKLDSVNSTWPCYGASAFYAENFRNYWMQDIYAWGEDTDMMSRNNLTNAALSPGGSFIYRRGLNVPHASGNPGMVIADMMHQTMVNESFAKSVDLNTEIETVELVPYISGESRESYENMMRL